MSKVIKKEEFECNMCQYDFSIHEIGLLASLDNSCSMSDMICFCKPCMIKRLRILLDEMRVPRVKYEDYEWLKKTVSITYRYHEHYEETNLILQSIMRDLRSEKLKKKQQKIKLKINV